MATVETPPAPPVPQPPRQRRERVIAYGDFIEGKLSKTRQQVKSTEIFARLATLGIGVLGLLLAAAIIDHWVSPLGTAMRWLFLLALVGGSAWYFITAVLPFFRRAINPVYAARTIEEHAPALKNSLVNLLLLRNHGHEISRPVLEHVEQQAATRLTQVQAEDAVDRSRLIRLGYVLLAVAAACAIYKLISPKDPFQTFRRVVAPWSGVAAPTVVQIVDVRPGDTSVFTDGFVEVEATVRGLRGDDSVTLYYSTDDGRVVDQAIAMQSPDRDDVYRCALPGGSDGLQQSVHYRIVAGDDQSPTYRVIVNVPPAIAVTRLDYEFPTYTGLEPQVIEKRGDVTALEGTKITITAEANQDIAADSAFLDFNGDGTLDLPMAVEGKTARVSFTLRADAGYANYQLRFTNAQRHENPQPVRHKIQVVVDQSPEVEIVSPDKKEVELPLNGELKIQVAAADRDFRLRQVSLAAENAKSAGSLIVNEDLLNAPAPGQEKPFAGGHTFRPAQVPGLAAGDTVHFWAIARDNKEQSGQYQPNVAQTEKYTIKITEPQENAPREDQPQPNDGGQNDQPMNQPMQGGENSQQNQPGGEGQQQKPDNKQGEGDKSEGAGGQGGGEAQNDEEQQSDADGQFAKNFQKAQDLAAKERQEQNNGGGEGGQGEQPENSPPQNQGGQATNNQDNTGQRPNSEQNNGGGERDETGMGGGSPQPMKGAQGNEQPPQTPKRNEPGMADPMQGTAEKTDDPTGAGQQKGVNNDGSMGTGGENTMNSTAPPSNQEDAREQGMGEESNATRNSEGGEDMPDGGEKKGPTEADGMGAGAKNTPMDQPSQKKPNKNGADDAMKTGGDSETPRGAGAGGQESEDNVSGPKPQGEEGVKNRTNQPMDPGDNKSQKNEADSPGTTKETNSNQQGGEEGDRKGGNQKGGGQSGGAKGTGGAGSNTASDSGAKAAAGKGMGEDSDEAGTDTKADHETGKSAGDEAGQGSKTRSGNSASGQEERDSGQKTRPMGDPGQAPPDQAPGDNQPQPDKGDRSANGQQNKSGRGAADPSGSAEAGPSGAADGPVRHNTPQGDLEADEADAEFAKKQTDLLLDKLSVDAEAERLRQQMELSPEEFAEFQRRLKNLRQDADLNDRQGDAARKILQNLAGPRGTSLESNQPKDDASGLNEGLRKPLPDDKGGDLLRSFLKDRGKVGR